jgi:hypothetical protein
MSCLNSVLYCINAAGHGAGEGINRLMFMIVVVDLYAQFEYQH